MTEQGNAKAQYNLGVMYANGIGVTQGAKQAVTWYRKAAEQGDARAQNNLGVMYAKGAGVTQDYSQAYVWLSVAVANGASNAIGAQDFLAKEGLKKTSRIW